MFCLLIVVIILTGQFCANPVNAVSYRLPQEVKPLKYHLEITPDFENKSYVGNVSILVKAIKHASTITLHQLGLKMPPKQLIHVLEMTTNKLVTVKSVGDGETELHQFFVITLAAPLVIGRHYLITIPNFEGKYIHESRVGFYSAQYIDEHGNNKIFATTHFQPTFARKAFPCFDEPALKANFNLIINRPNSNYISVTNTPRNEQLSHGLRDVFEETDLMSTYLVTFIISEMQFSQTLDRHRILAPKKELDQGRHLYALNKSYYVLNEMERYTGIPYSLKKLDHASIPRDYYMPSAMENWGLITYSETNLLVSANPSIAQRRQTLTIIGHEIGHQWFGNLVTPDWWDYIWMNEGFANYFENYLADKIDPTMDVWKRLIMLTGNSVMKNDANPQYTRPMTLPVENPNKILMLFDGIAYGKAGAVLRMLENIVTRKVFQQGLIYYLKDRKYQGATPSDLYRNIQRALDEYSKNALPVSAMIEDVMATWTSVGSFPLVTVTRKYGSLINNVHLKQRMFNRNNNQGSLGNWMIPINYATKQNSSFENTTPKEWLIRPTDTITVSNLKDEDWFIVNVQQSGYYRVNYDERNWYLIAEALRRDHRVIHPLNRGKLLDDCYVLVTTGDLSPNVYTDLAGYAVIEEDPHVLAMLQKTYANMDNRLYYTKNRDVFKNQVIRHLQGAYHRLTFEERSNDSPGEKEVREGVVFWLCKMGHLECRSKALAKFNAWKNNKDEIPVDLQSAIFCGAMRSNKQSDFDYLFGVFTNTTEYHFKTRVASGLSCMEDEKSLERLLHYCLDECSPPLLEHITRKMHASSKIGSEIVLEFVSYYVHQLQAKLGDQTRRIAEDIASESYSAHHLRKLKRRKRLRKSGNVFNRALDTMADNVAWLKNNQHEMFK